MELLQCEEIAKENNLLNIFVGANSTGKSYDLNKLFLQDTHAILLDEDGYCRVNDGLKSYQISADNTHYILQDSLQDEKIPIDSQYRDVIICCKKIKEKLNIKFLSLGAKKLLTIIDEILSYNLAEVTTFYFDEPENCLDDYNIKNINNIIENLLACNKKVFIVTHSPRLLENLRPKIGNIFLKKKLFEGYLQITEEAILQIQQKTMLECYQYLSTSPKWVTIYIKKPAKFYKLYIDTFVHSQDFYRSLFYNEITLAEGLTEKYIVHSIHQLEMASNCFIFSNGKFNMPFLINFYQYLGKKIYCIFDSDVKNNQVNGATQQINKYIESLIPSNQKIVFEPNLESELNVDIEVVKELFGSLTTTLSYKELKGLQHKFKPFIAVYGILSNKDRMNNLLQKLNRKSYEEWLF